MKINKYLIYIVLAFFILATFPACNRGSGCEATEKMKSSYDKKSSKKRGKTKSGLLG